VRRVRRSEGSADLSELCGPFGLFGLSGLSGLSGLYEFLSRRLCPYQSSSLFRLPSAHGPAAPIRTKVQKISHAECVRSLRPDVTTVSRSTTNRPRLRNARLK